MSRQQIERRIQEYADQFREQCGREPYPVLLSEEDAAACGVKQYGFVSGVMVSVARKEVIDAEEDK